MDMIRKFCDKCGKVESHTIIKLDTTVKDSAMSIECECDKCRTKSSSKLYV